MADDYDECMHGLLNGTCSVCNASDPARVDRAPTTASAHLSMTCRVCGVARPETKFPTNKSGVRLPRCRECASEVTRLRARGFSTEGAEQQIAAR